MPKPTVGRIVHYTNLGDADGKYPPEQQAAIITKVTPMTSEDVEALKDTKGAFIEECHYNVSLRIFYETGDFWMQKVPFAPLYERGHWTWPPRA